MVRLLLVAMSLILVTPWAASAQKDKMSLGEQLGAKVTRQAPKPAAAPKPAPAPKSTIPAPAAPANK